MFRKERRKGTRWKLVVAFSLFILNTFCFLLLLLFIQRSHPRLPTLLDRCLIWSFRDESADVYTVKLSALLTLSPFFAAHVRM